MNKQMWCGKLLCPKNSTVMKWNNCIGEYTTQNGTRYIGLWREGKTTTKGMFIFKNNFVTSSDLNETSKKMDNSNLSFSNYADKATAEEIISLQKILEKTGFYKGRLDGIVGINTLSAINSWLNENGYPPTNIITKDIIKRIYIHIPPDTVLPKTASKPANAAELENEKLRKRIAELEKNIQITSGRVASRSLSKKPPTPYINTTGSGFFVSKLGHIITNEHVVRQCGSVTVGDNTNNQVTASVLDTDKRNDLALLRISSTKMASAETKSLISKLGLKLVPLASEGLFKSEDVELGEDILVAGFPHGDFYSDGIKVTRGIVSGKRVWVTIEDSSKWMRQFRKETLAVLSMMRTETSLAWLYPS